MNQKVWSKIRHSQFPIPFSIVSSPPPWRACVRIWKFNHKLGRKDAASFLGLYYIEERRAAPKSMFIHSIRVICANLKFEIWKIFPPSASVWHTLSFTLQAHSLRVGSLRYVLQQECAAFGLFFIVLHGKTVKTGKYEPDISYWIKDILQNLQTVIWFAWTC